MRNSEKPDREDEAVAWQIENAITKVRHLRCGCQATIHGTHPTKTQWVK